MRNINSAMTDTGYGNNTYRTVLWISKNNLANCNQILATYENDYKILSKYKDGLLFILDQYLYSIPTSCDVMTKQSTAIYDLVTDDHIEGLEYYFDFSGDEIILGRISDNASEISASVEAKCADIDDLLGKIATELNSVKTIKAQLESVVSKYSSWSSEELDRPCLYMDKEIVNASLKEISL